MNIDLSFVQTFESDLEQSLSTLAIPASWQDEVGQSFEGYIAALFACFREMNARINEAMPALNRLASLDLEGLRKEAEDAVSSVSGLI